jgi:probable HAF family extracellular repeat protein
MSYSVTDLGTLGGISSYAYGINSAAQIVGQSAVMGSNTLRAFVWDPVAGMQLIGPDGAQSIAFAINESGQIAGWVGGQSPNTERGFFWDGNAIQLLEPQGFRASRAFALNSNGQIVGWSGNAFILNGHACLWTNDTVTDLGSIGSLPSAAYGINDDGWIAGTAGYPGNYHAMLWINGMLRTMNDNGSGATATAINRSGRVVGVVYTDPTPTLDTAHPGLWDTKGLHDLVDLFVPDGCYGEGSCTDINNVGQIVGIDGYFQPQPPQDSHWPAIWDSVNGWQDFQALIQDSGWTLIAANAINDAGQVAGYGINPNGETHACLLTPA